MCSTLYKLKLKFEWYRYRKNWKKFKSKKNNTAIVNNYEIVLGYN